MSRPAILFVCTGNTCRSQMAESVTRARLAAELGLDTGAGQPIRVESAGTSALPGIRPTRQTRRALAERDLPRGSRAVRLNTSLVERSTLVFGMTSDHVASVRRLAQPRLAVGTLRRDGAPIADPYGRSQEFYRQILGEIEEAVTDRMRDILALLDDDLLDDVDEIT